MAIGRALAATAVFTGLATALAAPAWSDMNGHYKYTETDAAGQAVTGDWYVVPCGDGCVSVSLTPSGPKRDAHNVNGQWVLDGDDELECSDGTKIPDATSAHFTWDANTLEGNVVTTDKVSVCGEPAGHQETNQLKLVHVS